MQVPGQHHLHHHAGPRPAPPYRVVDVVLEQKDDEVEVYRQRFAGSQAERADREAAAIVSAKVKAVSISGKLDTFRLWKTH